MVWIHKVMYCAHFCQLDPSKLYTVRTSVGSTPSKWCIVRSAAGSTPSKGAILVYVVSMFGIAGYLFCKQIEQLRFRFLGAALHISITW